MLVNFVITPWQQLSFFYRIVQSSYEIIKLLYQEVKMYYIFIREKLLIFHSHLNYHKYDIKAGCHVKYNNI